jgi:hypothetical protein
MKNVAILTFHSSNNYGALLQCYALSSTIESFGYKVSIINLKKEYIKDFEGLDFLTKQKTILKKSILNYVFQREFDLFRIKNLKNKFTKQIKNVEKLNEFTDKFDGIVVGSDQVWRYAYTKKTLESFFLDFASDTTKKVSYAASFGLDYFEGDAILEKKINTLINRFNAVSVREDAGVKICAEKFNIKASHVLDPVFLLSPDDYQKLIEKKDDQVKDKYLAYYLLNPDSFREKLLAKVLETKEISAKENAYTNEKFRFRKPSFPLDKYKFRSFSSWLATIKNAEFMVTDSFHGLAFSIIFNKQFICIANKARGASRMESILSLLGLLDRLVYEGQDDFDIEGLKAIDYEIVNTKLLENKNKSLNFLKVALNQ